MNLAVCFRLFLTCRPVLAVFLTLLLPSGAQAATLTVAPDGSGPYPTIQAAVNAAQSGDTVLLVDGTYTGNGNVDVDFNGKNLNLTSQNGPNSTVIDCQANANSNHRAFYLHSGETNARISGLTIQNGYQTNGAAVLDQGVSLTLQNCILKNNTAVSLGGAVFNFLGGGDTVTLNNCLMTGNIADYGGAVYNYGRPAMR